MSMFELLISSILGSIFSGIWLSSLVDGHKREGQKFYKVTTSQMPENLKGQFTIARILWRTSTGLLGLAIFGTVLIFVVCFIQYA